MKKVSLLFSAHIWLGDSVQNLDNFTQKNSTYSALCSAVKATKDALKVCDYVSLLIHGI